MEDIFYSLPVPHYISYRTICLSPHPQVDNVCCIHRLQWPTFQQTRSTTPRDQRKESCCIYFSTSLLKVRWYRLFHLIERQFHKLAFNIVSCLLESGSHSLWFLFPPADGIYDLCTVNTISSRFSYTPLTPLETAIFKFPCYVSSLSLVARWNLDC